ncbi:SAM-dependent methyltransferase [Nocardia callitridis]|uniref:SAM-dependent methyltransferase n=1 Tax=Nocardia callitridis TaxID=648753 RepID=A0ABP9KAQ6_9NOCA
MSVHDEGQLDLRQDRPHTARMYDWYLGGKDHYEVDRERAEEVARVFPTVALAARVNRGFMHRVTDWLAGDAGIRQFIDIGTGIPTEPNLHQIAQGAAPSAHVVYVDNDPIVLAHARALMTGTSEGRTAYVHADVNEPKSILSAPELLATIDLSKPVALSLIALLHFVPDDLDPHGTVATLLDALAPGSYLVLSHASPDFDAVTFERIDKIYRESGLATQFRTRAEFSRFFEGLTLVEPGITVPHRWRPTDVDPPESLDAQVSFYSAVAKKN